MSAPPVPPDPASPDDRPADGEKRTRGLLPVSNGLDTVQNNGSNYFPAPIPVLQTSGWKCEYCDKTFQKNSNYVVHVRSHTGERPFVCPYTGCGKDFAVRSNLTRHMKLTHDEVMVEASGDDDDMDGEAEGEK